MEISLKKISFTRNDADFECVLDENWIEKDFIDFISDIDHHLNSSDIIKDSNSVKAGITNYKNFRLFIKRYNDRGLLHRIKYRIKIPRPLNALETFSHLIRKNSNISVANHICAIQIQRRLLEKSFSFSIQKAVENTIPVAEIINKCKVSITEQIKLLEMLVSAISSVHSAGVYHGDAKLTNFFFRNNTDDYTCGIWDLDVARIYDEIPLKMRAKDLARISASFLSLISNFCNSENKINPVNFIQKKYYDFLGVKISKNLILDLTRKFAK